MVNAKYFLKLSGAVLLGLVALVVAGIIFVFLLPLLGIIKEGLMLFDIFLVLWMVIWVLAVIGVAIYYFVKHPMKVQKKGTYSINKVKEAGRRKKSR